MEDIPRPRVKLGSQGLEASIYPSLYMCEYNYNNNILLIGFILWFFVCLLTKLIYTMVVVGFKVGVWMLRYD